MSTPQHIATECAQIRAGWDEHEEEKRRRWSVTPPVVVVEVPGIGVEVE